MNVITIHIYHVIQQKQLEFQSTADNKENTETHAVAKPLFKLITDKCTDLDDELEQISASTIETVDDQMFNAKASRMAKSNGLFLYCGRTL